MSIHVNPDWWKTLFDETYLLTDARSVDDLEITRREVDLFCELLRFEPQQAILDLCGGQGRHSHELHQRGLGPCTVLDYSETLLELGRQQAGRAGSGVTFVQGDAAETGLPADSYDYVLILGNSLGYLPQSSDDQRIIDEAHRLLKPGGSLLLDITDGEIVRQRFTPNAWHEIGENILVCRQRELAEDAVRVREMVLCKERGLIRDQTYAIRTYGSARLEALLQTSGFSEVTVHRNFPAPAGDEDRGFMNHRLLLTAQA